MTWDFQCIYFNAETDILRSIFGIRYGAIDVIFFAEEGYSRGSGVYQVVKFVYTCWHADLTGFFLL